MLRDDLQTCGLDTGWQSKSHHCWKRRDWRSVIRVCEAPLPSPAPRGRELMCTESADASPSSLLLMGLLGHIPSWIIKRTADTSVPRKLPTSHCHHRVPSLLRKAQPVGWFSFHCSYSPPHTTSRKMMFPGRIPSDRNPFRPPLHISFSMNSSKSYLLKPQLTNVSHNTSRHKLHRGYRGRLRT